MPWQNVVFSGFLRLQKPTKQTFGFASLPDFCVSKMSFWSGFCRRQHTVVCTQVADHVPYELCRSNDKRPL
ncbi:hypothetical protein GGQ73_002841 [Rhizobium skierniewicense]|uniref:Uncharacterized protein n=1 Tax=Rhizobium skierniewicense TaxID=984260 RepID=A0A7W6C6X8_9HYPH|nr:hypothetical protein [Rhizobium skierniewicense]